MHVNTMRKTRGLMAVLSVVVAAAVLIAGFGLAEIAPASAKTRVSPRELQRFENREVRLGIIDGGLANTSTIEVSGFDTRVTDVDVTMFDIDFFGDGTQDIDVLVAGPDGRTAIILSDVGGFTSTRNVNLTLDDQQPEQLSANTALSSGVFQPTNIGSPDTFILGTGPFTPPSGASLGIFNGIDPNGTWTIVVFDDSTNDVSQAGGGINGGWALSIRTDNSVPETEADRFEAQAGKPLNIPAAGVLKNDSDPDGDDLTATLADSPQKGSIQLQSDGAFTYRARKKSRGTDSFTYIAEDSGGLTAVETVTIQIKGKKKRKR
jgi:hypothetical protein